MAHASLRIPLVLAALAFSASATSQTIFSMDYSANAAPHAGWAIEPISTQWTYSRLAGAGPSGQDIYEVRQLSVPLLPAFGGQFSWGWKGNLGDDPAYGESRFFRWRLLVPTNNNFHALSWDDGSAANASNKLLIVGQGCGTDRCRIIMNLDGERDRGRSNFRVQIDGGEDALDTPAYTNGQWLNIQLELRPGTSSTSANGGYRIWINNDNISSPTAQRLGMVLHPSNWQNVRMGAYMNNGLAAGGVNSYRFTDFQVARSFDSNWAVQGPRPNPPTALRVD